MVVTTVITTKAIIKTGLVKDSFMAIGTDKNNSATVAITAVKGCSFNMEAAFRSTIGSFVKVMNS